MLQHEFLYTEITAHVHDHQDLIGAIRVTMNGNVAAQYLSQDLEAMIVYRWRAPEPSLLLLFIVGIPFLPVLPGLRQRAANDKLHSHPGPRNNVVARAVDTRRVITQRKLHVPRRAHKQQFGWIQTPIAKFHNHALPSNGVCRTVMHLERRDISLP